MKTHPVLKIVNNSLVELPSPANIRSLWNFGSLLGLCLMIQILTGLFLAIHYSGDVSIAFYSVNHISRDVNFGWLLRIIHANGARFFFICLFIHIGRGLYYGSYFFFYTWIVGVVILLLVIATAFLGYVLPWGQMSFWGATVITNLFSAIPYIGNELVMWIWGGFAVDNATLTRLFPMMSIFWFILCIANFGGPFTYNLLGEILLIINLNSIRTIVLLLILIISFFSATYRIVLYSNLQQGINNNLIFNISNFFSRELLILSGHIWPLVILLISAIII